MSIETDLTSGDSEMQFIMDPRYPTVNKHLYLDKSRVVIINYDSLEYTTFSKSTVMVGDDSLQIDFFIQAQIELYSGYPVVFLAYSQSNRNSRRDNCVV